MNTRLFHLFAHPELVQNLSKALNCPAVPIHIHQFPDKEIVVKIDVECQDKELFLLTSLEDPNSKLLALIFAAHTLRQYGAQNIHLITPYLPYMRQDKVFEPGQGISAHFFAQLIGPHFDSLVTVDPHLHRIHSLDAVYPIACQTLHCAPLLAKWIKDTVPNPVLVGPDSESQQWCQAVAKGEHFPYMTLEKTRKGDRRVDIQAKHLGRYSEHTPVLLDDIISSGHTVLAVCQMLCSLGFNPPIVVAIHGLFAQNAYEMLRPHCQTICTTNAIEHDTNQIDLTPLIAKALKGLLKAS